MARNPERSVRIGGAHQAFATICGASFLRDLEGGRCYRDLAVFNDPVKLTCLHPKRASWRVFHLQTQ